MDSKHAETEFKKTWIDVYSLQDTIKLAFERLEPTQNAQSDMQCQFLNQILAVQKNADYKQMIQDKDNVILALNEHIKQKEDLDSSELIDEIRTYYREQLIPKYCLVDNPNSIFLQMLILFIFFLKENQAGPSVYSLYAEEEKKPVDRYGDLPDFILDPISNKNEKLQKKLLEHFSINGEVFFERTQFLIIFDLIKVTLDVYQQMTSQSQLPEEVFLINLWRARHSNIYEENLMTCAENLETQILDTYKVSVDIMKERLQQLQEQQLQDEARNVQRNLSMLYSEYAHPLIQHWKYDECESAIKQAFDLAGINVDLQGRLGKRTKYQHRDLAQLVLDISTQSVDIKQRRLQESESQTESNMPVEEGTQYVKQDEESILWEQPKLVDEKEEFKTEAQNLNKIELQEVRLEDQLAIQAYINYLFITMPAKEESTFEYIRAYVSFCVQKSNNWLTFSKALLYRCRNEIERTKTMERSMNQGQALIDQYHDEQAIALSEKLNYAFSSVYPMYWGVQKALADNYKQIGVYMSAYELLYRVGILDEAVKCLFLAGRQTQAIQLADKLMENGTCQSFNLMCLIGEMKKDHTWFERAWNESNHRSSRAARSLGKYYFYEAEYQKSIEYYDKSLALNKLQHEVWFTKGCAHMRISDWKGGAYSFGNVITINDRDVQSWANLANCYRAQNRFFDAVNCCEQALKRAPKDPKILNNYILYSIETLQFYKAVYGIKRLLHYGKYETINSQLMLKVSEAFIKRYVENERHVDDPEKKLMDEVQKNQYLPEEEVLRHKKYLYKLYDDITEKISDYRFWRLIGRVKENFGEPWEEIKEIKFKELRTMMKINWEVDIDRCKAVEQVMTELVEEVFQNIEPTEEEKQFVRITAKTIQQTLQRECKLTNI